MMRGIQKLSEWILFFFLVVGCCGGREVAVRKNVIVKGEYYGGIKEIREIDKKDSVVLVKFVDCNGDVIEKEGNEVVVEWIEVGRNLEISGKKSIFVVEN